MALITCGSADALRSEFHFPARGPWWSRLSLDTTTAPSGQVSIAAADGFSLTGTVAVGGVFADVAHVTVIGGAGGLGTIVPAAAYRGALLRDPLNAVLRAAGESLSSSVDQSILSTVLPMWAQVAQRASTAIDTLCFAATQALGSPVTWRVLDDGTVWLGVESWSSATLPDTADVLDAFPSEQRYVIGAATPALLPGVTLDGVGKVSAVDHFVTATEVRTWAWVVP